MLRNWYWAKSLDIFSVRACIRNNPDESGVTQMSSLLASNSHSHHLLAFFLDTNNSVWQTIDHTSRGNGFLQWLWPLIPHRRVVNIPLNPTGVPQPCGYVVYISGFRSETEIGWDCGPNPIHLLVDRFIGRRTGVAFSFHQRLNGRK